MENCALLKNDLKNKGQVNMEAEWIIVAVIGLLNLYALYRIAEKIHHMKEDQSKMAHDFHGRLERLDAEHKMNMQNRR